MTKDKFDSSCIGYNMNLDEETQTITMKCDDSNTAFLTNIIDSGIHYWKFKINKCHDNNDWSTTIGIWKVNEQKDNDIENLPLNTYCCAEDFKYRAYGFAYNVSEIFVKLPDDRQ